MVVVGDLGLGVCGHGHAAGLALRHRLGGLRQALEVELVGVALAVHLLHDVLVVIVPERAAQLVVVHVRLALPLAPLPGHLVRIQELELAVAALPADAARVRLVGEQLEQELPELNLAAAAVDGRQLVLVVVLVLMVVVLVVVGRVLVPMLLVLVLLLVLVRRAARRHARAEVVVRVVGVVVAEERGIGVVVVAFGRVSSSGCCEEPYKGARAYRAATELR